MIIILGLSVVNWPVPWVGRLEPLSFTSDSQLVSALATGRPCTLGAGPFVRDQYRTLPRNPWGFGKALMANPRCFIKTSAHPHFSHSVASGGGVSTGVVVSGGLCASLPFQCLALAAHQLGRGGRFVRPPPNSAEPPF